MNFNPKLYAAAALISAGCGYQNPSNHLTVKGLEDVVTVVRDSAGVNHIYAANEHDLFFAQGYCAARDRLFQFELWRRQATGTVAEILGPGEVNRDIGARLFSFRGDLDAEFSHYHPHGKEIISNFTAGINAYVAQALADTSLLPIEFKLLGIQPGLWKPRDVISRHQGLLANLPDEMRYGRAVAKIGAAKLKQLVPFEPGDPDLTIDPTIDQTGLFDSITLLYSSFRATLKFKPEHLQSAYRNKARMDQLALVEEVQPDIPAEQDGSNNWVISGTHSTTGFPILANDPHRTIAGPSLRYMVHLNAPGWNVVGGGEPTIPGVSIGHNDNGAWGLTVFALDAEDIYVYKLNPADANQYEYKGAWETMTLVADTIPVKGSAPQYITHRYTRHGPVMYIDTVRHVAYAARCAWLDIGAAPYLASLRMDQAASWEEFREACSFSRLPGENMIWADKNGNIGWQAVGVAPVRRNHSGLVPVPGDGRFEWDGYLPIKELPNAYNPETGFFASANEDNIPSGYPHTDAVGKVWADKFRVNRIREVLTSRDKHAPVQSRELQCDYTSLPARTLVPLLSGLHSTDPLVEALRTRLLNWNFIIDKNSTTAAVYVAWERKLLSKTRTKVVQPEALPYVRTVFPSRVIEMVSKDGLLGNGQARNQFLLDCFEESVAELQKLLGPDTASWQYGQEKFHHVLIRHPLSQLVDATTRATLDHGPLPRGGNSTVPCVTGSGNNQASGASFRMVADLSDWDNTMFTNTPGQSGDPRSPYYGNLFASWANDRYFPVYFSWERVEASGREKTMLVP